MRKLVWFAIGFGSACAVCAYFPAWWALPLSVSLIVLVLSRWSGSQKLFFGAVCVALGCVIGLTRFLLFDDVQLSAAKRVDAQKVQTVITAHDYAYETKSGIAVDGTVALEGKSYRVRVYLYQKASVAPGDTLHGTFRFRLTTPDSAKGATFHSGNGIFLLAYAADDVTVQKAQAIPWQDSANFLRRAVLEKINALFPADTAAFASALLLGDDSQLDYRTDTAMSVSGIRHIVAVSGLHISILCLLLMTLTLRRRILSCVVCIPALVVFAAMVGFTPSVVRACISAALMLIAELCLREFDGKTALAASALVMLTVNPWVITSVSFQLSIGSVTGILLFYEKINRYLLRFLTPKKDSRILHRAASAFSTSVAVSLSAACFSVPLVAWHFGMVSIVSVLSNLLTIWAVSAIFIGILAACLLGAIWVPLGSLLAWTVSWLIRYVVAVAEALSALPIAAVYTESKFITVWLVFVYALLALFAICRVKRPDLFGVCAVLSLCIALMLSWLTPLADTYRVTVLDVGQGQCIMLQAEGKTFLVDCGGDYDDGAADTAAQALISQGVFQLDGLIVTHFDRDHAGGVEYLLQRIPADFVYLPQG